MNQKISSNIAALCFGVLVIVFVIGFYAFAVWTEPTAEPPLDNVDPPINVGPDPQIKQGPLQVDGFRNIGRTILDGDIRIIAIPDGTTGVYTLGWDYFQICQFGTCCSPWEDCDGDGHTFLDGMDCDEGCATCFVGSLHDTASPDGRDQNCDGVVDNPPAGITFFGFDADCAWVREGFFDTFDSKVNCEAACPWECSETVDWVVHGASITCDGVRAWQSARRWSGMSYWSCHRYIRYQ